MYIIKASGKRVRFNPIKIRKTCLRAGADQNLANDITNEVTRHVYENMETREILKLILKLLRQKNPITAARYNLKKAILDLGPAGFIFEEFILRLLRSYGYQTWFPPILSGICTKHEVDIIARSPSREINSLIQQEHSKGKIFMVECKYHNKSGIRSGLKEALYVWARFLDLHDAWRENKGQRLDCPWLISNTKFSESAIQYAQCKKMRLLGWQYPRENSLESLIEEKKIYPITILRSLDRQTKEKLFFQKIIFCKDLLMIKNETLKRKTKISELKIIKLINEAKSIIE
ncbi:MAG: ATP cone domain-containing protein [Patescibacteria group bacterium]|jgi:hypothetical protein|nr:ATP cone domain-containing protein [Patescibacteria group bacterium]MDD5172594.1 ATP cone domain-containing protein [Patescibacteria group bacterium]